MKYYNEIVCENAWKCGITYSHIGSNVW
jgi:hypothetical protein